MANLNKVMLIGNLTKDAELRYIPSGQPVLEFRLAVSRRYRTQAGEDREESLFIDVSLWGRRGEAVSRFLTRGTPLFVEGRLKMDEWERDGQRRSKMTVVAQNIEFLGRRNGEDGGGRGQRQERQENGYARNQGGSGYQQGGNGYQNAGGQQGGAGYQQGGAGYQQGGAGYQQGGEQQGGSSYQAGGGGSASRYGGGSSYGGGHDGQSSYQGPPTNGPSRGQTAGAQAAGAPEVAPPVPAPVVDPQPVTAAAPPPGLDIADDEVPF